MVKDYHAGDAPVIQTEKPKKRARKPKKSTTAGASGDASATPSTPAASGEDAVGNAFHSGSSGGGGSRGGPGGGGGGGGGGFGVVDFGGGEGPWVEGDLSGRAQGYYPGDGMGAVSASMQFQVMGIVLWSSGARGGLGYLSGKRVGVGRRFMLASRWACGPV